MAEPDSNPSFGGMPLGVLELNVFIAGVEAVAWLLVLRALFGWPLPDMPDKWAWWLAPAGAVAVLGLSVLGLAVEGTAGITERLVTRKGGLTDKLLARGELYDWYARATNHPDADKWRDAQRWIWTSPQAAAEYGRRRLRILVARNTTFNILVLTFTAPVLVGREFGYPIALLTVLGGTVLTALFGFVWIDANRTYHRAIADAGAVDRGIGGAGDRE